MPRGLTAMALNSSSIRVSWESPNASIDFHYLVTFSSGVEGRTYETTETEYTPTELKPSSPYNITVWLLDMNNINFGIPAYAYAKTLPIVALMPRGLTAMALNSTSIRVSWESPNASIDFQYLVTFSSGVEGRTYETTETEFTTTELKPSSTYNITVRLLDMNNIHFGNPVYAYAKTLPIGLIPRDFMATALHATLVSVSWSEPERSSELSGRYQLTVYLNTSREHFSLEGTGVMLSNLQPSSRYEFALHAFWKNDTPVPLDAWTWARTPSSGNQRLMPDNTYSAISFKKSIPAVTLYS
ncbi:unnamed protein product [Schistocephalus solidus]|uniref:Fibronectin type III domain protein n=1 Tax=Schistocephalus solidus TaxID=70667 RepID=A0A183TLI3_SCHSO|nr:unnamed protein product [Schistocephalus solidus]